MRRTKLILAVAALALANPQTRAQQAAQAPPPAQLNESGQLIVDGQSTPYRIRRLPISSFPDLPAPLAELLTLRGCMIPQTYEANHPENVVHASLESPGSSDWAALCSSQGTVSLLVYFASAPSKLLVLASVPETARLQVHDVTGVLGFNWGIDPATAQHIHEMQTSMEHRPARLDHDALADSTVDRRTVYRFYLNNAWTLLDVPE